MDWPPVDTAAPEGQRCSSAALCGARSAKDRSLRTSRAMARFVASAADSDLARHAALAAASSRRGDTRPAAGAGIVSASFVPRSTTGSAWPSPTTSWATSVLHGGQTNRCSCARPTPGCTSSRRACAALAWRSRRRRSLIVDLGVTLTTGTQLSASASSEVIPAVSKTPRTRSSAPDTRSWRSLRRSWPADFTMTPRPVESMNRTRGHVDDDVAAAVGGGAARQLAQDGPQARAGRGIELAGDDDAVGLVALLDMEVERHHGVIGVRHRFHIPISGQGVPQAPCSATHMPSRRPSVT